MEDFIKIPRECYLKILSDLEYEKEKNISLSNKIGELRMLTNKELLILKRDILIKKLYDKIILQMKEEKI